MQPNSIRTEHHALYRWCQLKDLGLAQGTLEDTDPMEHVMLVPRVHEHPGQPHDAPLVLLGRGLGNLPLASLLIRWMIGAD